VRLGTVLSLPDVVLAELVGAAADLVWLDLEHGALSARDVPALAIALRAAGCEAHVRLPAWDDRALEPALDAGVAGVVAPRIERAAHAAALVQRLRHPPAGSRGYGPRRAGGYGRAPLPARVFCTAQIESPAGVAAAAEIAAVDGIDALVVGCADLSHALGAPLELTSPALAEAVAVVAQAAHAADVAFGLAGGGPPCDLLALPPGRPDLVVYSVDVRLYARGVDDALAALSSASRPVELAHGHR
jgi:2-keto-3-deoxy-L-rhamnonate aldolase RhmA